VAGPCTLRPNGGGFGHPHFGHWGWLNHPQEPCKICWTQAESARARAYLITDPNMSTTVLRTPSLRYSKSTQVDFLMLSLALEEVQFCKLNRFNVYNSCKVDFGASIYWAIGEFNAFFFGFDR